MVSTDIYMTCEVCKEAIWIAQEGLGGFTFYSGEPNCMKALSKFIMLHYLHKNIAIKCEQDVEEHNEIEWQ